MTLHVSPNCAFFYCLATDTLNVQSPLVYPPRLSDVNSNVNLPSCFGPRVSGIVEPSVEYKTAPCDDVI